MQNKEAKYLVALSKEPKFGARTLGKLLKKFESPEAIWLASSQDFRKKEIPEVIKNKIFELKAKVDPDQEIKKLQQLNIDVLTIFDKNYPRILKEISDHPVILYVKGQIIKEDELAISIVGSRKHSIYGSRVAEDIARDLSRLGVTIVSGLALGIDSFAHKGALLNPNGRTIAVLPCGLDRIYPATNRYLAQKIYSGNGAIISEYPLGTEALKFNFPVRNRIIAGLSLGTIVVEADLKSGTFLTATAALNYNREVFAIPGSIYNEKSIGPNNLIRMGARLVTSAQDIFNDLNLEDKIGKIKNQKVLADTKEEEEILKILSRDKPMHIDILAKTAKIDIVKINQTIIIMEMKGKVKNLGANQYVIN